VAVGVDCRRARAEQASAAARLREHGRRAVLSRARVLATLGRAPAGHLDRQRTRLHQQLREVRAGSRRRLASEHEVTARRLLVLQRKADAALADCRRRRPRELEQLALALAGHDPQRTLERGYALVQSEHGQPVATAAQARAAEALRLRFLDGTVPARVPKR